MQYLFVGIIIVLVIIVFLYAVYLTSYMNPPQWAETLTNFVKPILPQVWIDSLNARKASHDNLHNLMNNGQLSPAEEAAVKDLLYKK